MGGLFTNSPRDTIKSMWLLEKMNTKMCTEIMSTWFNQISIDEEILCPQYIYIYIYHHVVVEGNYKVTPSFMILIIYFLTMLYVRIYGMTTFVPYLMPNPVYIYTPGHRYKTTLKNEEKDIVYHF